MFWSTRLCVWEARAWLGYAGCPGNGEHWPGNKSGGPPALHHPQLIPSAHTASHNQSTERRDGSAEHPMGHQEKKEDKGNGKGISRGGGEVWTPRPEPWQRPGKLGEVPSSDPEYISTPIFTVPTQRDPAQS